MPLYERYSKNFTRFFLGSSRAPEIPRARKIGLIRRDFFMVRNKRKNAPRFCSSTLIIAYFLPADIRYIRTSEF